jgi:pyruvate/2-oxoglutarate dehydrogenase complex dihydrolipoamide acyltransferase (E2) component
VASEPAQAPGAAGSSPRFSGKALPLLEQFGLRPEDFAGMGLVREQDVRDRAAGRGVGTSSAAAAAGATPQVVRPADKLAIHPAAGVGTRVESLPRSKRVEIRHLRAGAAHTLPSAVTVAVPTNGFLSNASQRADAIGLAAAAIIFETARLLRRYPMFNAYYHDDAAHYYEQVNIGYAVDVDRGLKVPVIHNADRRSLQDLAAEKQQRLVEYLDDALPLEALAGGTFTITDLSHEGVTHFQPVIHEGQAAILGVCAEWQTGGEPRACFNLVLAFDHQLADGRTAATFLRELRDRLRAHEASLGVAANAGAEAQCSLCFRPVSELAEARHYLVRTIGTDGRVDQAVCTMCLADW